MDTQWDVRGSVEQPIFLGSGHFGSSRPNDQRRSSSVFGRLTTAVRPRARRDIQTSALHKTADLCLSFTLVELSPHSRPPSFHGRRHCFIFVDALGKFLSPPPDIF